MTRSATSSPTSRGSSDHRAAAVSTETDGAADDPPVDPSTPIVDPVPETERKLAETWADPPGLFGKLMAVQNDAIGKRLLFTGFFFLLLGGSVDSMVMRVQLAVPENDFISPELYNELFTNHGSVTMFLVILPITEGFAILLLPFLLGSREMPFPRLGAYSWFTYVMGGLFYYSSTLFQLVPDAGWFAYTPLSLSEFSPDLSLDFWVLGLSVAEVAAIAAGIEIIISILKFRAPGMTLARMPLMAWALLVTAFMIVFAFTTLVVGSFLLEMSRSYDMKFFEPEFGGSSLLWQHLFWIFGHPEVYIQFLPGAGAVSMIIPVLTRRKIAGYPWLVAAFVAIGFMSFALWAHHMFAVGLPPVVSSFFSAASIAIGIPAGVQIFAWLATMWVGRPQWKTPLLFVTGFIVTFVIGGITGIMVASAPFDLQAHDSYFVVGHLHYVLIGGVAMPFFAAAYFWLPKFNGVLLNERLGQVNFWLMFVGLNVTFFPMHIAGLMGMPRRVYTYDADTGWGIYNLISTIGAFVLFAGVLTFIVNYLYSRKRGQPAGANPWGGDTLEWSVPSPPVDHGFSVQPIVRSRHPLWDQDDLHTGDPHLVAFLRGLARWPLTWRAAIVTGINDGEPEEVIRVSGPSIWPFAAACATVLFFIAEMIHSTLMLAATAALIILFVILWNRPERVPTTPAEEEAFEHEHGISVRVDGGRGLAMWGMGMSILVAAIAWSTVMLSYFYLRIENESWPPADVDRPGLGWPLVAAVAIIAGAVATTRSHHLIKAGSQQRLVPALVAGAALTLVAGAVLLYDLTQLDFTAQDHAYGSIFYLLSGTLLVLAVVGVAVDAVVIGAAVRGEFSPRRFAAVTNAARYGVALAVMWVLGLATLYVVPRLS
jgi:cytochrome c oxidase subunit I+III